MNRVVKAGKRTGAVKVPASKSQAHRQLICAALSDHKTKILCDGLSKDIEATIGCLNALGAEITVEDNQINVHPVPFGSARQSGAIALPCGESGSTLRFLLPVAGALGKPVVFKMEGRLPERPLEPFAEELRMHGMQIRQEGADLICSGQLRAGSYTVPGNISSQFISGLLMSLPLLPEESRIDITGSVESQNYILMTEQAVQAAGIVFEKEENAGTDICCSYRIPGGQTFSFPEETEVERDWSNAAFFLCMGAVSEEGISVTGLNADSAQGDKEVVEILRRFGASVKIENDIVTVKKKALKGCVIDASRIPDLVPALSVVAAAADGITRIVHAERLRIKESDRLMTVCAMLSALGAEIEETEDGLLICGKPFLDGGTIDAAGDHRIAMAAAEAATICRADVVICGSECANKSYPAFFEDLESLGIEGAACL